VILVWLPVLATGRESRFESVCIRNQYTRKPVATVPTLCSLLSRVKALSIRFSLVVRFGVRPWIEWLGSSLVCRSGGGPVRANPFATSGYLVDPASSHMLVSKLGRCFLCVCCVLVRCVWVFAVCVCV